MGASSRVQPPWPAQLDSNSRYLSKLTHAVLPGYMSGAVNLVTGEKPTIAGSGLTVSATSAGRAARFGNVELQYTLLPPNASLSGADDITMLVVHQYNGDTSINQSVVGISSDLCFVSPNSTTASVAVDTSSATTNNFTTLPALVSGRSYVSVLTKTAADSYNGWLDGQAGTPATVSSTWAAGGVVSIGRSQTSKAHKGDIALVLIWNRVLDDNEIVDLSRNPWQILEAPRRVYKAPAAGGAITTGLGQLTITGLAPTVTATAHVSIGSGLGALTLTGLAPRLDLGISSGLGSLVIAGLAPTVSVSENVAISPGLGALTITGLAPSVAVSENVFITSGLGALVLTGLAPQVGDNPNISTGLGALTITGHAPSLSATEHQFATPSAGALAITGLAPDVRQQLYVSIGLATLTINGFAPTVTEAGASITTGLGELVIIGYAPSIQGGEAEVSRGAGRRTKRERYIARYKGEEFEFSTYDDLEEFVQQVKKAEAQKPRKIRKPVRIRLEPSFVEEIREYVDIPAQIYQLPASKALEQVRKLEMSIKKVDDDDEEEIWLILTG